MMFFLVVGAAIGHPLAAGLWALLAFIIGLAIWQITQVWGSSQRPLAWALAIVLTMPAASLVWGLRYQNIVNVRTQRQRDAALAMNDFRE